MANQTHLSKTDSDATLVSRRNGPRKPGYRLHFTIDAGNRMVLDCYATAGSRHECPVSPERVAHLREHVALPIGEVIADRGFVARIDYKTAKLPDQNNTFRLTGQRNLTKIPGCSTRSLNFYMSLLRSNPFPGRHRAAPNKESPPQSKLGQALSGRYV